MLVDAGRLGTAVHRYPGGRSERLGDDLPTRATRSDRWSPSCSLQHGTVVLIGCGGSSEETETFSVQDGTGTSYELTVTTNSSQECFELDGGDLGEWCGEPVENVTTVEVIGSAGSGVPNEGDAGTRFTYAVVGVAPIATGLVRVRLDDSIQEVQVTEGEGYSAWAAMFDITVPSDEPLESPPQPTISAEASD